MPEEESIVVESVLLAVTRVSTLLGDKQLTNATGFFFARDNKLFLITNRHVVLDEANDHRPDRLEIEFHVDPENLTVTTQPVWQQRLDSAGTVDVIALQLERAALPTKLLLQAFTSDNLVERLDEIEVGMGILVVGFSTWFSRRLASSPRRATGGYRLCVQHSFSGTRLLPNRCADASRHKRRSSGRSRDDTRVGSWRITMAVAGYPCRSNGYEQPGRRARRETKLELRLVR
jgi:hypothetical protein